MAPVLLFINPQVSDSLRSRDARFAKKVVAESLYPSSERIWGSLVPRNTDVKPGMGCRVSPGSSMVEKHLPWPGLRRCSFTGLPVAV